MAKEPARVKKRERKNITSGVAHVNASFNNTMITITDAQGNTISWSSRRHDGLQGLAQVDALRRPDGRRGRRQKAQEHGVRTLEVEVSGPGFGPRDRRCARCRPSASPSPRSATSRRSRTTAAVRRSAAASRVADPAAPIAGAASDLERAGDTRGRGISRL